MQKNTESTDSLELLENKIKSLGFKKISSDNLNDILLSIDHAALLPKSYRATGFVTGQEKANSTKIKFVIWVSIPTDSLPSIYIGESWAKAKRTLDYYLKYVYNLYTYNKLLSL